MRNIFGVLFLLWSSACRPPIDVVVVVDDDRKHDDHHSDNAAVDDVPIAGAPIDNAPVDDAPIDEAPIEDAPIEDVAAVDEEPSDAAVAFIGAACVGDDDCLAGGFCFSAAEGFIEGTCSLSCTRLCPDSDDAPVSFCVDDPLGGADGVCLSRCDVARFGDDGCRDGYRCEQRARHEHDEVVRGVCWPDDLPTPDDNNGDDGNDDDDDDDDDAGSRCTESALPLVNAGLVEPAGLAGCLAGMAPLDAASCMDRWEAFVDVVGGTAGSWSPYATPAAVAVVARSAPGAVPQSNISGTQAAAACAQAGKRLCRATEWSGACRGAQGFTWPWGNDRRDGVCNDARAVHPAVEYFGTSASWIWARLDHPCINQLPDSLAKTGSHPACVTATGHFDLVGNLHEWIADSAGTFRGGFYVDTVRNGVGCLYTTTAHDVSHHDYSTGFRCCADRR